MLEPDYFNYKSDQMIEIYQELENYILTDIANRLITSGNISGTSDRLIWKLTQMGEHRSTILAKLSKINKMSKQELRDLLQDAVLTSWQDDISVFNKLGIVVSDPLSNPIIRSIMDAEYRKSLGELENLTRTTIDQSQKDLIKMFDEAEIRIASGVQSYSSAITDILDNYASNGIKVKYASGAERTLESAVRMAVVTSMNQTSAQITNQYIIEGNVEYVLVSAHYGARLQKKGQPYLAGHENWQGKAYKIRGSTEGFPNLAESTGYDISPDGTGKVIDPRGLHGYNCRHSHKPWDSDLKNPYLDENGNLKIDTAENRKQYELQQKQRAAERNIRKTKRELLMKKAEIDKIAETDIKEMLQPQYDRLAYKLREQNKLYDDFCKSNNLNKQYDRIKVAGFKRPHATEANRRATIYKNSENKFALSDNEQNYKSLERSETSNVVTTRNSIITTRELINYKSDKVHISDMCNAKPKQIHNIIKNYSDVQKMMYIKNSDNNPSIIIAADTEMRNGVLASYRASDNIMFINENILNVTEIETEVFTGDNIIESTIIHELYHWYDAQRYIKKFGKIDENYLSYNINESKRKLEKILPKDYNYSEISLYADFSADHERYDEVYTEYRTKRLVNERKRK